MAYHAKGFIHSMNLSRISHLLLLTILSGCMLGPKGGPDYRQTPASFVEEAPHVTQNADSDLTGFWKQFDDPCLMDLIKTCTEANFDLRMAREKVKELRATYRMESADLWPSIDAFGSVIRLKKPATVLGAPLPPPSVENLYVLGFDASWEIDFFGKVRSQKKAAYFDVLSQEENVHSVQVTIVAEVARLYTDIRARQQRTAVLKKKIATQKKILSLSQVLMAAGLSGDIDVEKERATLAQNETLLPTLEKEKKDALYQLSFLLGKYPEDMQEILHKRKPIPFAENKVPIGLPSDLLKRRPDIRIAEKNYYAASARIGSAKADLFPSISLSGAWSTITSEFSSLFSKASQVWFIWPSINWNIFQGWKTLANIKVQNSKQRQTLITYEQSIAKALSEVESSLSAYAEDSIALALYKDQLRAKSKVHSLYKCLLTSGLKEDKDVLIAAKDLLEAQDSYLQGKQRVMTNLIALYKSLGGGWQLSFEEPQDL